MGVIDTVYPNMPAVHLNQAGEPMVAPIHTEVKLHQLQINGKKNSISFDKQNQIYVPSVHMFSNILSAHADI